MKDTYILPAFWGPALINCDYSGYTENEAKEIRSFIDSNKQKKHAFYCLDMAGDTYFSHSNDANNMGGEVCEFIFDTSAI